MIRSLLLVGTMLASAPALAQSGSTPASDDQGVTDIVVTAQRREQSVQDIPLAVSAFSADDLQRRNVTDALDLSQYVPNFVGNANVGIGTANSYYLRGLGNTESIATFDPPVGTYIDDIYVSRQNANNFTLFDVERIEVLRGPQGVTFGRNTTGGAVNIILRKPAETFGGYLEGSYGRFDRVNVRGSVDLPLSESVRTKLSGFYTDDKGYVNNLTTGERLNGERSWGARLATRVLIGPDITWDLSGDYIESNVINLLNTDVNGQRVSFTGLRRNRGFATGLISGEKNNFGLGNDTRGWSITSNLGIALGSGTKLELITGYRDLTQNYALDFFDAPFDSGGFTLANAGKYRQFSQEAKINGTLADGKLSYVAGAFYLKEDNLTDFADIFNLGLLGLGAPPVGFPLVLADRVLSNKVETIAGYVQLDYKLVDALTVTAGVRYTDELKTLALQDNLAGPVGPQTLDTASIAALGIPTRLRARLWTPRFAVSWQASPDILMFASATRGFKSGGWNARGTTADQITPFSPEKVWSYEAGFKSEWLDRRLRFNVTAFRTDVDDYQIPSAIIGVTGPQFLTGNFAGFRNTGVEIELTAVPVRDLNVYINMGLQDAQLRNPSAAIVTQIANCRLGIAGNCDAGVVTANGTLAKPVRSPDVSISAGFSYAAPLGGGYRLIPAANLSVTSDQEVGTNNGRTLATGISDSDGHALVNASLALEKDGGKWRLALACDNCLGSKFIQSVIPGAAPYLNAPGTWTITARHSF